MKFKQEHSEEDRIKESSRIRSKYPDRAPIIVEKGNDAHKDIPDIDKKKFLVPMNLTMGQLQYVIRKRIKINPEKAIFLFVGGKLYPTSELITNVYTQNVGEKDDGFLYVEYSGENTFG